MTDLFCIRGTKPAQEPRRYETCGLDNIWLVDGFEIVERDGVEYVVPEDVEGLHKAIALHLARFCKTLAGCEIRFIRHAMDMTQAELAHHLGTGAQTVARWEKNKVNIPRPEDRLLRITAIIAASDPQYFAEMIAEIPKHLTELEEGPELPARFRHHGRTWAYEEREAA